jgi:poly(hydroxyalkanoate) depolymerase family esterase
MKSQKKFNRAMVKASCLTGMGKLVEATKLVQRSMTHLSHSMFFGAVATPSREATTEPQAKPTAERIAEPITEPVAEPSASPKSPLAGHFLEDEFEFEKQLYPYRLFVPASVKKAQQQKLPLVVLLHGCKQDALDFSQGTAMNQLADEQHCLVLYPEQITAANVGRCWNWFEPEHQQRGQGEPGMIAALTLHVLTSHGSQAAETFVPDPARVYIAGLSAGGAMASVVAGLYPDIYAALGVHSGLPAGSASSLLTALNAMQIASPQTLAEVSALPTIVFHGSADATVHPDNSEHIARAAQTAFAQAGISLTASESQGGTDERAALRTVYSDAKGVAQIERWSIAAGEHAWSGGDAAGSYTDPQGPSASAAMLAFFLQHKLKS